MAALLAVRKHVESQGLIEIRSQDRALEGGRCHGRSHEEALIEGRKHIQRGADFFAKAGGRQPYGRVLDTLVGTGDIAADRRKSAARILDQGADDHICADVGGLLPLYKFAVAVVDHADHVRTLALDRGDGLPNLGDAQCAAVLIALGTLDRHQMDCGIFKRLTDAVKVKCAVGQEVHLLVADAVLGKGSPGGTDSDHFLQRIVGSAGSGKKDLSGAQIAHEGQGQRMGAACDLRAHQCVLGMKVGRVHSLEPVSTDIVVSVPGRAL